MRIDGQWLWCDDGVMPLVIRGEIVAGNGVWEKLDEVVYLLRQHHRYRIEQD